MASSVSDAIANLQQVTNGSDMRDAVVDLLEAVNSSGTNALTLDGHPVDYFATKELLAQLELLVALDSEPIEGSTNGVTSGGLYTILHIIDVKLRNILGEEEASG